MAFVKYSGLNILTCNGQRFLPGVNEVDGGVLKALLLHPLFKARVDSGKITIFEEPNKDSEGKMPIKELLRHIPNMYDKQLLEKLVATDGRAKVVEAAKEQLVKISVPKEEEKKKEADEQHFQ
jgi:hypothetical protein